MTSRTAVGIDVGGTSIKGLLVDSAGRALAEARCPTPANDSTGERTAAEIAAMAARLDPEQTAPLGVVVPGIIDVEHRTAVLSSNLGWSGVDVGILLDSALGREFAFGHDVRAGALAEATWGAAAGRPGTSVFVAIGTGLAAGIIIDGHPLEGGGWAGEIGQVVIGSGHLAGQTVESVVSASAIARRMSTANAREAVREVERGVPSAQQAWTETVDVLADSLANLSAALAPSTIIIGGGLSLAGETLLRPLRTALGERLGLLRQPELCAAALGDHAAALGAAELTGFRGR